MVISEFEAHALIDAFFWPNFRPSVKKWLKLTNEEAINMLPDYCFIFAFLDEDVWTVLAGLPARENVQMKYPLNWQVVN